MTDQEQGWVDGKYKFPLSQPIDVFGDPVSVIVLRSPLGGDIMAVGNPVETNLAVDPPTVKFDDAKMGAMISRLGGIPPASLAKVQTKDLIGMGWILANFFTPI